MSFRTIVFAFIIGSLGCSVPDLALDGLECPCVEGWRCDLSRDICVEESAVADSGSADASTDATSDAGSADAGRSDVGMVDAGPVDAEPVDAEDAGLDALLVDAGPDAGPSDPCAVFDDRVDVYRCDSFERVDLGYPIATTDGTIEITDERAHSGTRSALATPPSEDNKTAMLIGGYPNNQDGERWFRGWFFVPSIAATFGVELVVLESVGGDSQLAVYSEGAAYSDLHGHGLAMPDPRSSSVARFLLDTWVCIEVHVDYSGSPQFELFFDSVLATQIETPAPTPLSVAAVGLAYVDPDLGQPTVFVDDVILSSTRIGCAP